VGENWEFGDEAGIPSREQRPASDNWKAKKKKQKDKKALDLWPGQKKTVAWDRMIGVTNSQGSER